MTDLIARVAKAAGWGRLAEGEWECCEETLEYGVFDGVLTDSGLMLLLKELIAGGWAITGGPGYFYMWNGFGPNSESDTLEIAVCMAYLQMKGEK